MSGHSKWSTIKRKKEKFDKLLQENYFDGELAVAILKLDDIPDYNTYKIQHKQYFRW